MQKPKRLRSSLQLYRRRQVAFPPFHQATFPAMATPTVNKEEDQNNNSGTKVIGAKVMMQEVLVILLLGIFWMDLDPYPAMVTRESKNCNFVSTVEKIIITKKSALSGSTTKQQGNRQHSNESGGNCIRFFLCRLNDSSH